MSAGEGEPMALRLLMPMSLPTCSVREGSVPDQVGEDSKARDSQTLGRLLDKMEALSSELAGLSGGQRRLEAAIGEVQRSLGAIASAAPAACSEPTEPLQEPHAAPRVPLQDATCHSPSEPEPRQPLQDCDVGGKERSAGAPKRMAKAFAAGRANQTVNDLSAVEGWKLKTGGAALDRFEDSRADLSTQQALRGESRPLSLIERFADSMWFDHIVAFLILANSVLLGVQVQLMAVHVLQEPPEVLSHLQWAFTLLFLAELLVRLRVRGWRFFVAAQSGWNCFDFVIVWLSSLEMLLDQLAIDWEAANNLSVLRVLKVVRVVRVIRVLRFFRELRVMVYSILGSMLSLVWAMALLFITHFVAAVFFTQVATAYRADPASDERVSLALTRFLGSLFKAMFYLLQGVLGGISWGEIAEPLWELHWSYALLLAIFVCFTLLAMLNIVTGVFVDGAIARGQNDREAKIQDQLEEEASKVQQLEELFEEMDTTASGCIVLEDFERFVEDPKVKAYFQTMGLNVSTAYHLFRLLDLDDSKSVSTSEFIMGCLRMQGTAKNVDVATLMYENKRMMMKWVTFMDFVEECFNNLLDVIVARDAQEHARDGPAARPEQRRSSWKERFSQQLSAGSLNVYQLGR